MYEFDKEKKSFIVSDPSEENISDIPFFEFISLFQSNIILFENKGGKNKVDGITEKKEGLYKIVSEQVSWGDKIIIFVLSLARWLIPLLLLSIMQYLLIFHFEKIDFQLGLLVFIFLILISLINMLVIDESNKRFKNIEKIISFDKLFSYIMTQLMETNKERNTASIEGIFWNLNLSISGLVQKLYIKIDLIIVILAIVSLSFFNFYYSVLGLFIFISICVYAKFFMTSIQAQQSKLFKSASNLSTMIHEMVLSTQDLKTNLRQHDLSEYIKNNISQYQNTSEELALSDGKHLAYYDFISFFFIFTAFILYISLAKLNFEISSLGTMFSFYLLFYFAFNFKSTFERYLKYKKSESSILFIDGVINSFEFKIKEVKEIKERIDRIDLCNLKINIDDKEIIKNATANFEAGSISGITGSNGSGKTTIIKTLLDLQKYDGGKILINGKEIPKSEIVKWQQNFSYFSGDSYLYSNSVANNITFNIINNYKAINEKKARLCNLQLSHLIFANGSNISLGERQKILLDRFFYKTASVYILDEPGAYLDSVSKEALINKLFSLKKEGKIVILVSHDRELLGICDQLYKIQNKILNKEDE